MAPGSEETFPTCLADASLPVGPEDLDAVCDEVAPDSEETFPACLADASPPIGPDALNELCALNEDAGEGATFPTCLDGLAPVGLPEGCDPTNPPTCAPAPDLGAVCATLAPDSEETFPTCLADASLPVGPEDLDALCDEVAPESEETFPACLADASPPIGPDALNELCALNEDAGEGATFPTCLDGAAPGGLPEGCDPTDPPTCAPAPDPNVVCATLAPEAEDDTFPGCLSGAGPGGLPEGCEPGGAGFPQEECGVPAIVLEVLDGLCDVVPGADPEGTFPMCLLSATETNTAPTVAAGSDQFVNEGSLVSLDATGEDADDDPLTYTWDCVPTQPLSSASDEDPTFPAPAVTDDLAIVCTVTVSDGTDSAQDDVTINVAETNVAPSVDAGDAEQTVTEGDIVNLVGSATDDEVLDIDWSCEPAQSLASATSLSTSFTAPSVGAEGLDIICTLTADDGDEQSSDFTTIHVEDDPVDPLVLSFSIDSLAAQDTGDAVLVTGTVSASQDVADALIGIALSDDNEALGSGAQNIVWSAGNVDTIDLLAGSPEAFEALVSWNSYETVTWTITVGLGSTDFDVTFNETATFINFGTGNAPAALDLAALSASTYSPNNVATLPVSSVLTVTDPNGAGDGDDGNVGRIVDDNVDATLANGDDTADVNVVFSAVNGELARDFDVDVTLPARLDAGTYTLTASYENPIAEEETGGPDLTASVDRSIAVGNVAPVLTVPLAGIFAGTERVASSGTVAFLVDDYNAGTLSGADVIELDSLALSVREAAGGACTGDVVTQGLTLGFTDDGGATAAGAGLDFSDVAFDAAIPVVASLSWGTTALAGAFELCATLADADGLEDADNLLATFALTALNAGFHLTIDDGGNGLAAPGADPGESSTSEALSILFSGTTGADELVLTVGTFQRSSLGLTFTAQNLNAKLCLAATCVGDDVHDEAAGVGGIVTFSDLSAVALPGVELFVVFEFEVPLGTASGNYAAPITVAGVEAP